MCGRYRLSRRKQIIAEHFDAISDAEDWIPRYNVAPTQPVPVIRQNPTEPTRHLSQMRWGLIPSMVERCLRNRRGIFYPVDAHSALSRAVGRLLSNQRAVTAPKMKPPTCAR